MRQILDAFRYCHSKRVVHGNIQPQYLLLANKENSASVKLGGFGSAADLNEDDKLEGLLCDDTEFQVLVLG